MKLIVLALFLAIAVTCHVSASSSFDDFSREQLWELLDGQSPEETEVVERSNTQYDKSYLDAKKHPERLRLCVKCVGKERQAGKNVKQATARCNSICKRSVFDTRSLYSQYNNENELEERDFIERYF